mgnify:CR=1 FL=1
MRLESIRNRSGLMLAVIGVAMLAFIMMDLMSSQSSGGGQIDVSVGKVYDESIDAQDFENRVQEQYEQQKQNNPNRSTIQHAYWIKFENDNHLKYLKKIGKPVEKKIIEKSFQNNYNLEISLIWPPLLTKKGYNVNFYSSIKDLIIHGTEDEVKKLVEGEKKQGYKGKISYVRLNQNIIDSLGQKFPFSVYGYNHNTYSVGVARMCNQYKLRAAQP